MVRRVTVTLAALLIAGCASSSPTVPPSASAIPAAATAAVASETPPPATSEPTRSRTAPPSATPPQPSPSASVPSGAALPGSATPTSTSFWAAIRAALDGPGGRLSIAVRGEFAAELRYEPTASATVVDGSLQFVCRAGRAYDGQAGFSQLDGRWACGSDALVRGFRTMGQPVDAWSPDLPLDSTVRETYDALDDGSWRWRYRAENPILGEGQIRVSVVIDPTTGRILTASRSDPLGTTTWTPTYGASFPSIAVP